METPYPKIDGVEQTVKGEGVSFMEGQMKWHYYRLTKELRDQALEELS